MQILLLNAFSTASQLFYMLSGPGIQIYMQISNYKEDMLKPEPKLAIYTQAKN